MRMRVSESAGLLAMRRAVDILQSRGLVGFTDRLSRWLSEKRRSIVVYTGSDGIPRVSSRYRRWIAAHPFDACEAEKQRMLAEQMPPGLTISLVMPVFNPPPAILGAAIESVLAQTCVLAHTWVPAQT